MWVGVGKLGGGGGSTEHGNESSCLVEETLASHRRTSLH